jgi:hypothetical protein
MGMMFFGTWIDANGDYFDTAHFPKSLINYSFKGGGCYSTLGTVEVDYHFQPLPFQNGQNAFKPDHDMHDSKHFNLRQQNNCEVILAPLNRLHIRRTRNEFTK